MHHVRIWRMAIVCLLCLTANFAWARGGTASGNRGSGEERPGGGFRGGVKGREGHGQPRANPPQAGPTHAPPPPASAGPAGPPMKAGAGRGAPPSTSVGIHGNQAGPQRPVLGSNQLGENPRRDGLPRRESHPSTEGLHGMPGRDLHREPVHAGAHPPYGPPGGGRPVEGPHGGHGPYRPEMMHTPGPHWHGYHEAHFADHPVHLARPGYYPSYYYHPWYHGPWAGHPWGWGWGYGPGMSFGLAGSGWGVSVSNGWGYPVSYGPYGPYGYWGRPLGWGFGGWGLGTTVYTSGYYVYENPYYSPVISSTIVYDYSRPIPVIVQASAATPADAGAPSNWPPAELNSTLDSRAFASAREAFRRGEYARALDEVDSAIRSTPSDAVMHEFRSLVLFALRDYHQSAAVAHAVLAVGPGWDYTTMSGLYPNPFTYSDQLRQLEEYSRRNPGAADAHFLLAYHNLINSRKEAALAELQQVVALMPNDRLAAELLTMVKGPAKTAAPASVAQAGQAAAPTAPSRTYDGTTTLLSNTPYTPRPTAQVTPVSAASASIQPAAAKGPAPSPDPVDKSRLPGTWSASRTDGSKFQLVLTDDGKFTWTYSSPHHQGEELTGNYSVEGPVLILERNEGGALAGVAKLTSETQMNFKLVGAPTEDQGLDFEKNE